jgi:predicted nucleotidyltransferase
MEAESVVIARFVRRIVETVHPLRVILFGSAARGQRGPDGDIDFLVVMPEGVHRRKTAQLLYQAVESGGVPFDVIVATPSDLEAHKDNPGLIYREILREGRELYAA